MSSTLEEYRADILGRIKACTDPVRARDVIAEVDLAFSATSMSEGAKAEFWQTLTHDLSVLAHRLSRPPSRPVAKIRSVIAIAQAAIAHYQRQLRSDE
jgi:hypothetical protein